MSFDPQDPLPPVATSDIRLSFELVLTVPATASSMPLARIQELVALPGSVETYVSVDNRGVLSWVSPTVQSVFSLDFRDEDLGFFFPGNEGGLRSFGFHPDAATPGTDGFGKAYVAYSATVESAPVGTPIFADSSNNLRFHDVVAELTFEDIAAPSWNNVSVREMFRIEQAFNNHNFGQMRFDPFAEPGDDDYGLLYLGIGDGGGGGDPLNAGQDLEQILGSIIRIDPLANGGAPYSVPADNPFVGVPDALDEIWAYGLRNPQTLVFTEDHLYTGDIGQNTIEEVNVVVRGGNYGWDIREGTVIFDDFQISELTGDDAALGLQSPFTQYDHEEISSGGEANAAGPIYRGDDIPGLSGQMLIANFPTGEVFMADTAGVNAALADGRIAPDETIAPLRVEIIDEDGSITSFADVTGNAGGRVDLRFSETPDGEVLVFSKQTGNVYRLTSAADDILTGTAEDNVFYGGVGDDSIEGLAGSDFISGGEGNDLLIGDGDGLSALPPETLAAEASGSPSLAAALPAHAVDLDLFGNAVVVLSAEMSAVDPA